MKIKFVGIQNFRKLKKCRIPFGDKETLFVGANNSGKTSAIDALINFLDTDKQKRFSVTDFTLSNWTALNEYAETWGSDTPEGVKARNPTRWSGSIRNFEPVGSVALNPDKPQEGKEISAA